MAKYILIAIAAYTLGNNLWAYPTQGGISFGLGDFGYHHSYSE